ncbi:hypothetical protein BDZ90DRAFT_231596 [Jaminaea rosea]|uniref:Uncharacterized protein n=1 Tax=Jaminaea rosea TaxID=1569628 RepID=A0A316UTJ6_9BASI|nr:hypothetical protein BDZ90DRAFT_231596 [Jaminaea rosea]PWN28616.1 hypothetical protein BDZ90DRAFT_231596 [Jaminaea rosea]
MKLATFSLVSMCASTLMLLAFIAVTEGKKPGVSDVCCKRSNGSFHLVPGKCPQGEDQVSIDPYCRHS